VHDREPTAGCTGSGWINNHEGAILQLVGFNPPAKTAAGFETHPTARPPYRRQMTTVVGEESLNEDGITEGRRAVKIR